MVQEAQTLANTMSLVFSGTSSQLSAAAASSATTKMAARRCLSTLEATQTLLLGPGVGLPGFDRTKHYATPRNLWYCLLGHVLGSAYTDDATRHRKHDNI